MNMKSYAGFLAMTMMMGGVGMSLGRKRESYRRPNTLYKAPEPLPEELGIPTNIPKGHTTEPIDFAFNWQGYILTINCTISYGTKGSRHKKIASTQGILAEYIKVTPLDKIKEFGQFRVSEDPRPKVKPKFSKETIDALSDGIEKNILKGVLNGNCNRTVCQKPGAVYYNHSTEKYYCSECADKINKMNPESFQIYGHQLCTFATEPIT